MGSRAFFGGLHMVGCATVEGSTQRRLVLKSLGTHSSTSFCGADLVSSAFGCLPEEKKVMFPFQKVPSSKIANLVLFINPHETPKICVLFSVQEELAVPCSHSSIPEISVPCSRD